MEEEEKSTPNTILMLVLKFSATAVVVYSCREIIRRSTALDHALDVEIITHSRIIRGLY